jgi:5-methylcytosine-specific restriction protein A
MSNFDYFSDLNIGDKLNNEELCKIFKCSTQGGMRKSNTTNSLVLVSDQTQKAERNPYNDKWKNGVLHYTGMGLKGNQSINFAQNKTLANLEKNNVKAFLFEKFENKIYTFKGEVFLSDKIYYETQEDNEGNKREVIKFPLQIVK